jgi:hypothetical protein
MRVVRDELPRHLAAHGEAAVEERDREVDLGGVGEPVGEGDCHLMDVQGEMEVLDQPQVEARNDGQRLGADESVEVGPSTSANETYS